MSGRWSRTIYVGNLPGDIKEREVEDLFYKAEKMASRMIYEDRMRGSVDQVEAVTHFEDDTEELQQWDQQIARLCQALNDILDSMSSKGMAIPV